MFSFAGNSAIGVELAYVDFYLVANWSKKKKKILWPPVSKSGPLFWNASQCCQLSLPEELALWTLLIRDLIAYRQHLFLPLSSEMNSKEIHRKGDGWNRGWLFHGDHVWQLFLTGAGFVIMLSFRTFVANDLLKSFQANLPAKSPLLISSSLETDWPIPCLVVQIMANLCHYPMADVGVLLEKGLCIDLWEMLATSFGNQWEHDLAIFFQEPGCDFLLPVLLTIKPKAKKE